MPDRTADTPRGERHCGRSNYEPDVLRSNQIVPQPLTLHVFKPQSMKASPSEDRSRWRIAVTLALRLDALRKSHVLAAHLDLQYTLEAVCICMQLCGPGCPAGAIANERIIDCVFTPIAGGQFAAIQRLLPQNRKKVGYSVIAYASTLPRPGISQVFLKAGHEHLGADLIDTGRYGFARCPCSRAEQGYRHR
jgi:hypothetical protein